jgi:acetoin utilization deacetylase AcuC-like enzyme
VRDEIVRLRLVSDHDLIAPDAASWDDLARVHTGDYLQKARDGGFSLSELAQLEIPWTREVMEGFRLMTGGTVAAARLALGRGAAVNLGGGFHHAFAAHGEGFCLFNDVAVAVRVLQGDGLIRSAVIVDCDVHHGNGTAMIFERDPSVFTFSIHQQHNYPVFKPRSSLDIGLPDGAGDEEYLRHLASGLGQALAEPTDLTLYLAGADPFEEDRLGGLGVTKDGLRRRDRMVLEACRGRGIPVTTVLAGGYARRLDDTVAIHVATVKESIRAATIPQPS